MNKNTNQICLEKILTHITKQILLTECDTKELRKLVSMATEVSAQLSVTKEDICNEDNDENECEDIDYDYID